MKEEKEVERERERKGGGHTARATVICRMTDWVAVAAGNIQGSERVPRSVLELRYSSRIRLINHVSTGLYLEQSIYEATGNSALNFMFGRKQYLEITSIVARLCEGASLLHSRYREIQQNHQASWAWEILLVEWLVYLVATSHPFSIAASKCS